MPTWRVRSRGRPSSTCRKSAAALSLAPNTLIRRTDPLPRPSRNAMRSSTAPARSQSVPIAVATPAFMRDIARGWHTDGCSIGLVPTMGALHAGHMSLVDRARRENDKVIVSVFVNPIQFGAGEDLARYPQSTERDMSWLRAAGVDVIYKPAAGHIYPPGPRPRATVPGGFHTLGGAAPPGHFEGVATVGGKALPAPFPGRGGFCPKGGV